MLKLPSMDNLLTCSISFFTLLFGYLKFTYKLISVYYLLFLFIISIHYLVFVFILLL